MTPNYSKYIVWFTFFIISLYIISLFLPTSVKVAHTELIYGEVEDVYEQLYDISNWKNWCVWNNEEQKSLVIYDEKTTGAGASFRWKHGKKYNSDGKIELLNVQRNKSIEFYIKASSIDSIFTFVYLHKTQEGVEVEWISDLELNNSGSRIMGYFLKRWLLRDIKKSLRNINQYFLEENKHSGWMSETYDIFESKDVYAISITDTVLLDNFLEHLNNNYQILVDKAENEYDLKHDAYFYKKISKISKNKEVYKFYLNIKGVEEPQKDMVEMDGKYLFFKYIGSTKGVKNCIPQAKKIAKKEKLSIDPQPYVTFKNPPIDFDEMDSNSMNISFAIR